MSRGWSSVRRTGCRRATAGRGRVGLVVEEPSWSWKSRSGCGRVGRGGRGGRLVLHAGRARHHHVHLHAGRPVPRAAHAAHLQVQRPAGCCQSTVSLLYQLLRPVQVQRLQLHQHVLHVQEHARLHAPHVQTHRHPGQSQSTDLITFLRLPRL